MIVVGDKHKAILSLIRLEAFAMEKLNITILSGEEDKHISGKNYSNLKVYVNDVLMLNSKAKGIHNRAAFLCAESTIKTAKPEIDKTSRSKNADIINIEKFRESNALNLRKM